MSEENNNFDVDSQQRAAQAAERLAAEQNKAIEEMNLEQEAEAEAEERRLAQIKAEAAAYGAAARATPKENTDADENDSTVNFDIPPSNQAGVDFNGSAVNDDNFSFSPNNQTPNTYSANNEPTQSYTYNRSNGDNSSEIIATATSNLEETKQMKDNISSNVNPTTNTLNNGLNIDHSLSTDTLTNEPNNSVNTPSSNDKEASSLINQNLGASTIHPNTENKEQEKPVFTIDTSKNDSNDSSVYNFNTPGSQVDLSTGKADPMPKTVGNATLDEGNTNLNFKKDPQQPAETVGSTTLDEDELKGVYATEEMFSARFVPQPFYLSDRFKNTWKECMTGFQNAKDPAEAVEQLFWGFVNLAPKMALAYTFHLDDQEIQRKRDAQHDKEEYDQQLLLMKGLSPAEFSKHKCDWVFGSEELHNYLLEHQPDLPRKDGYVNINDCTDDQKKKVREHVENFIKENPYYKTMIENFTHREFSQDELNREARGMAPAIFRMQGRPKNLTRNGEPITRGAAAQGPSGPHRPTNGPDTPTPPTNGPDNPTPPTNGPDNPTPPNGPGGGKSTTEQEAPVTPHKKNLGWNIVTQGQRQKVQGTVQTKGALKKARPTDTTVLYNQARVARQNMSSTLNAIQLNRENGAAINRALRGAPSYTTQRPGYEYAQQNMGHVA